MDADALRHAEDRILCRAIQEAIRHIDNGDVAAGYQCLLAGLERAAEFAAAGERWANDLVREYRAALFEAERHYPVSRRVPMTIPPRSSRD